MAPRALALFVACAAAFGALAASPEDAVFRPGVPMVDTDGNRMYVGGANMYLEDGVFYIVGEGKKVLSDCSECLVLYSSADLSAWKYEGCVLNNSNVVAPMPGTPYYRMERPKIFKCPATGQHVMWFHCDTPGFAMRSVGVLTAPAVTGPYTFAAPCFKPDGRDSYDMGTFVDSPAQPGGDGHAYLIRSVENSFAGISQMTSDCLNVTGIVSHGPDMEGQAIMRDAAGALHAAGSHLTGWAPNGAQFVTSPNASLVGAAWVNNTNPSGDATTYDTQSTFIFPYAHADGHVTYIWLADRWNMGGEHVLPGGLDNMTNVWLPLLPPAGGPPPPPANATPGTPLALAPCDPASAAQAFAIAASAAAPGGTGSVTHAGSGLCVTGTGGTGGTLTLGVCDGSAGQAWAVAGQGSTLTNGKPAAAAAAAAAAVAYTPRSADAAAGAAAAGCVSWNNDNAPTPLPAGNPIVTWTCGAPAPAWNERWQLPAAGGAAGGVQARSIDGGLSGLCAAAASAPASGWRLNWLDSWSLKDY